MNSIYFEPAEALALLEAPLLETEERCELKNSDNILSLSPRGDMICRLYVMCVSVPEIARRVACHPSYVQVIIASKPGKELIETLRTTLEDNFKNLQYKVNEAVDAALSSTSIDVALDGAKVWAQIMGKGNKGVQVNIQTNIAPVDLSKYMPVREIKD